MFTYRMNMWDTQSGSTATPCLTGIPWRRPRQGSQFTHLTTQSHALHYHCTEDKGYQSDISTQSVSRFMEVTHRLAETTATALDELKSARRSCADRELQRRAAGGSTGRATSRYPPIRLALASGLRLRLCCYWAGRLLGLWDLKVSVSEFTFVLFARFLYCFYIYFLNIYSLKRTI